jgi:hypothetical protein
MAAAMEQVVVRAYREGDEAAILELFARAFHHRRTVERWRWQYRENPYANERISLAVGLEDGGGEGVREILLAHYAGYPLPFWDGSGQRPRRLMAHQIGDTMSAPEARGVGHGATSPIARAMQHFFDTFCEGRIAFNYGMNTGKVRRFSRRMALGTFVGGVPFRVRSLVEPFRPPGPLAIRWHGWTVEPIEVWDARWDDLWHRVRSAYGFLVERDARYLGWRHGACPDALPAFAVFRRRTLVGWSVFRRLDEERVVWGDALFDPRHPEAIELLLARACGADPLAGARTLEGWLTPAPAWWGDRVERLGFLPRAEPQDLGMIYRAFTDDPGSRLSSDLYSMKADTDLL